MLHRYFIMSIALCAFSVVVTQAQTEQKVEINEATVFLNGAELYSTTKISLKEGESEFLFTNVAGNINIKSLHVGADNNAVVQSATFRNNYLSDDNKSNRAQEIEDSIDYLNNKQESINTQIATVDEQIAVIQQNRQIGDKENGLSVAELQKLLDLVKVNMNRLLDEKNKYKIENNKLSSRINLLQKQLNEEKQKGVKPGGQLLVKFYSKKATTSNISISYVVLDAGWTPSYDLRVDEVGGPVQLGYKAHVYQSSGVQWDKIKLNLSTGNPNEGAEAPILNPWYLAYYRPKPVAYNKSTSTYGSKNAEEIEKMPTRNTTSIVSTEAYSQTDGGAVNIAGGRTDGTLYIIDGVQVYGSRGINFAQSASPSDEPVDTYTDVDNQGVNTVFNIDLPYTIQSDGKQVNVEIKTTKLPATYRYYAVPKLDNDAFLQAQITGWEDLNLLPAPTNVFYEGTYVGEGFIDVRNIKDTMNLSLGRDKKIVLLRERDKELRTVKTIGSNIKERFVYKISVRNTRNKPIEVVVLDQLPISNNKSIEVSDREYEGAEHNETKGLLTWKLQIEPNKTQEIKLGYTVKYPKNRNINL